MSRIYSRLLNTFRAEINAEANSINNRLRAQSKETAVNTLYNELAAQLPTGAALAVLHIGGPDAGERSAIRFAIENRLVNSTRRFTVLDRTNLSAIYIERFNQMSQRLDSATIVQIGHEIGARFIIDGDYSTDGSRRTLTARATCIATRRVYGSASVTF
ncbi:MAG: hypothetical protein FWB78_00365 [Treponema sp.]|nr:hypothetical protein [Treponema sp.]